MAEDFTLALVEGELVLRDAEEPFALDPATAIAGTIDGGAGGTGAISGADLATPTISFQIEALGLPVDVDATLSSAAPGSGSGSVDADGNVLFQTALTVDLHIDVSHGAIVTDCRATPITLTLNSTAPYDPATGRVTLADPDFSVPAIQAAAECHPTVAENIDGMLGGGGHAIEMTMEGDLALPTPPECQTVTSLAVDPAPGSELGDPVTLAAGVAIDPAHADDPACDEAPPTPAGFVDFLTGATVVGTAPLAAGIAALTTAGLPAGTQDLTARYRGEAPYAASDSAPTDYLVAAQPGLVPELPSHIEVGAPAVELDVTVTNTGFGRALTNARLDLTIRRLAGMTGPLNPSHLTIEHRDDVGNWQPVDLADTGDVEDLLGDTVGAQVGPATGFSLPAGASVTIGLRVAIAAGTLPGPVDVTFTLAQVDPGDGTAVGTVTASTLRTTMVEATRRPSTVNFKPANPVFRGPVDPHTVSQGHTVLVPNLTVGPAFSGVNTTGFIELFVDGGRVPVAKAVTGTGEPLVWAERFTLMSGGASVVFNVPADLSPGVHEIRVKYSGDALFAPSQAAATFYVTASVGTVYECLYASASSRAFNVTLSAQANMPAVAPGGTDVALSQVTLRLLTARSNNFGVVTLNEVFGRTADSVPVAADGGATAIEYDFGVGTGTATATRRTLTTPLPTPTPMPATSDISLIVDFEGSSGSLHLDGAPGQVHEVALESLVVRGTNPSSNLPLVVTCVPQTEAISLGSITQGGVVLSTDAAGPVREGDAVSLSASVAPASPGGIVEFRDGEQTIGVVPVADGVASMATSSLPSGSRSVTARYFGTTLGASYVSDPLVVEVVAIECGDVAVDGDGAMVRLVYLELLGRCPDRGGFDHWVGRLEGGTSAEAFARAIARTPEAVGKVVDDAYEVMLGRAPDPAGRAFWVGRLQASGRYDALLADLGASGEFWAKAGATDTGFVTRVYEQLLGRSPDTGGLGYWVDRLDAGASRRALIVTLANLDEPLGRLVVGSYDELLDRAPTAGERSEGIAFLRSTGDRSGLYAELIGRPEFATRAQGFPNQAD